MKNLCAVVILFAVVSAKAQNGMPVPTQGKIERIFFDSRWVDDRNVDVWLPEGYPAQSRYAVLYMHDGQMLYDSGITWNRQEWGVDETVSRLIKTGAIKNTIVVGIWNNGEKRHAEYFPQKALANIPTERFNELKQRIKGEPQADNYLRFIVEELKPFIDSKFATLPDFKNTFISGSSMGGLISMYAICEYPNIFAGAACLSTHWIGTFSANDEVPDAIIQYMKNTLPSPRNHKIYFDYGTETLDANYPPQQKKVDTLMRQKKFKKSQWQTHEFKGADHSEKAWAQRLDIPLTFLLGN